MKSPVEFLEVGRRELIGKGLTSEVFAWGAGRVLKLFYEWAPRWRAEREFDITRAVHRAGLPAPAVFEVVEVDGRPGIVFERVDGPSLLKVFERKPWQLLRGARLLAELHARLHEHPAASELPKQAEQFERWIAAAKDCSEDQLRAARECVARAEDGNVTCHGDFHPENILMSARGPVIIDWGVASRGNAVADVARTASLIEWGELPEQTPWHMRVVIRFSRGVLRRVYLKEYFKLRGGSVEDVRAWDAIQVAGRSAWKTSCVN